MIRKINMYVKVFAIGSISIITLLIIGFYVFAIDIGNSSPEIDLYRNGSMATPTDYPITGGSGVEYNGFRIGNTVWCKKGDVLGVTVWGKQFRYNNDMNNSIQTSFLNLFGTISPSEFSINQPFDSEAHTGEFNTIGKSDDITLVSSRRGRTVDTQNYLHYGALFWLQFNMPDKTYLIRSNEKSYNGSWLADENDFSKWPQSNENIKTDGTAPEVQVTSDNGANTDKDIDLNMKFFDSGSGIQYYQYQVIKDGAVVDNKTFYPQYHSDITANSYFVTEDDKALYNNDKATGGYVDSYDPEKTAIPYAINNMEGSVQLNGIGNYTFEVTVVDNLGNKNTVTKNYVINEEPITVTGSITPNPAKQGSRVILDINTTGNAKYLSIAMPEEITINDERGTIFPINKEIKEEEKHEEKLEYIIPLKTPQTIKKGTRIENPYKIGVTAKKADGKTANCELNLDVSGNVLEGIKTEITGTGFDKNK
ncbi:hypothetical protein [Clostridium felsineum]|uniref:hypothetical protein n=1 Tax=Clostridium felsineum TaxID=36839 RepID=UPI00098C898C|nr:hypothetical protein [Clostridium felsineum]URZ15075.1 hypothetical protein CLFE_010920 [Clostridium felsineum DSM 794]